MRKVKIFIIFIFSLGQLYAQNAQLIKNAELKALFSNDTCITVINAWATWCKPCIQEMPLFVKSDSIYHGRVSFVFVSFDFVEDSQRVNKYIGKLNIPGQQYIVDETDMDMLINLIDKSWSGTLPATWFIGSGKIKSHYLDFSQFDDIQKEIEELIAIK
jgi:thiol-disulfide isomerase/thioredoxin